jgi:molybdate transport system substrate-binding protein
MMVRGSRITALSSMAMREVLRTLADRYQHRTGVHVEVESVGGPDAARRIREGEPFDVAILIDDAVQSLESSHRLVYGTRVALASSEVAIAVRADAPQHDVSNEHAVRSLVAGASRIAYSAGPSGAHLVHLLHRWGLASAVRSRLVPTHAGASVGMLVAAGRAEIGFQQLSELVLVPGIRVAGTLPPEIGITTIFSGGVCATSGQFHAARAWLWFLASPESDAVKRQNGMAPASRGGASRFG